MQGGLGLLVRVFERSLFSLSFFLSLSLARSLARWPSLSPSRTVFDMIGYTNTHTDPHTKLHNPTQLHAATLYTNCTHMAHPLQPHTAHCTHTLSPRSYHSNIELPAPTHTVEEAKHDVVITRTGPSVRCIGSIRINIFVPRVSTRRLEDVVVDTHTRNVPW